MRIFVGLAAALAALVVVAPAVPASNSGFFVGFDDDLPMQNGSPGVTQATTLGGSAFRFTLQWAAGESTLTASDSTSLGRAVTAASGKRIVLSVYGTSASDAPVDATGRAAFCAYVKDAVSRFPTIRDAVIWNEPNKRLFWNPQSNAPALYEALLAQCYDVLHPLGVNVIGLAVSSTGNDDSTSTSPGAFIRGVGSAYVASGRATPLMDTVGFHPYPLNSTERPWVQHVGATTIGEGDWNKLMYNLWLAFHGTAQPLPGSDAVQIWYLEDGFQTAIPPAEAGSYTGSENATTIPDTGGDPDQATQVGDAIRLAACQPAVGAFFNFMLVDDPLLSGWQSGAYWADLTPKGSWSAFQAAIGEATGGSVDCTALAGGRPSSDFMPPTAPTGLTGHPQTAPLAVSLSWSAATDDSAGALVYRVYRNGTLVGTTSGLSWTNVSVSDATTYGYTVRAIDAAGNLGDASSAISVTTPDATAPSVPGGLTAQATTSPLTAELSWQAATDNVGVSGYQVSRDGTLLATVMGTSFTDATVASAVSYTYTVTAVDAAGNRSSAATVGLTTPAASSSVPAAPSGVTATAGDGQATIVFTAPAANGSAIASYTVTAAPGGAYATGSSSPIVVRGLTNGTSYTFTVTATNAIGTGAASAPSALVTPAAPAAGSSPGGGGGGGGALPNLHVSIGGPTAGLSVGSVLTLAVPVANTGGAASAVTLSLELSGLEFVSAYADRGPGCAPTRSTVSCYLDFFPAGGSSMQVINLRVTSLPASAHATLQVAPGDADPSDDAAAWIAPAPVPETPVAAAAPVPPIELAVVAPAPVRLEASRPSVRVTVRVSKTTRLRLTLVDPKRHVLVTWTKTAKRGTSSIALALPREARHAGRDTLRISVGKTTRTVRIVLRA